MEYLLWVLIALLAYSFVAPLTSVIMQDVPATPGLFLSTFVFLVIASSVLLLTGTADPSHAVSVEAGYVYVAGVFLTVGILAYTAALETGPVSVVVPIFGMFIVGSSVLGILFLGETMSLTRAAGIVCAMLAIVCSAGDGR
ncbi:EamA family transporter [Natronorubrum sp. FCH18a]|uniref:EamA family transporter n=1 Tax=Natronorubrum sp. FCH18a TaxID=3447018 RepID=UPI003F50D865